MSKQIAVRLSDDLVEFVDDAATRQATSRAAIVSRALERERRRAIAERDVAILSGPAGSDADLDGLAAHVAPLPIDLD